MATILSGLTQVIVEFSDLFFKRAWPMVQVLLTGAIVTVGPRTGGRHRSAVRMAVSQEKQFQQYYRVLNRVKWSPLASGAAAPGARGWPRRKEARQPTLKAKPESGDTAWCSVTLSHWYGDGDKAVEIATNSAVWYSSGVPIVPLRDP